MQVRATFHFSHMEDSLPILLTALHVWKSEQFSKCTKNIVTDLFLLVCWINRKAVRCNRVGTNLLVALGEATSGEPTGGRIASDHSSVQ